MELGRKFQLKLNASQARQIKQWAGAARFLWNQKVEEWRYQRWFCRRLPIGTYPVLEEKYAHFRGPDWLWLNDVHPGVYKDVVRRFAETTRKAMKGDCGWPQVKKRGDKQSFRIPNPDMFSIKKSKSGGFSLVIGKGKNSIGPIKINASMDFQTPKSCVVSHKNGQFYVSFCFLDDTYCEDFSIADHRVHLQTVSDEELDKMTVGIDRGVKIVAATTAGNFSKSRLELSRQQTRERNLKRYQRKLSRQVKGSNRRNRTKQKIARVHEKNAQCRLDFTHKMTHELVTNEKNRVFVLEKLNTKAMTRTPKPVERKDGKGFEPNKAKAKAGLNKAILSNNWHEIERQLIYKTRKTGKVLFFVPAFQTSQECADCGHTHPDNRKSQALFKCLKCGVQSNADENAARVIKKRAIRFIKDPGLGLSDQGVFHPFSDSGRRGNRKTKKSQISSQADEVSTNLGQATQSLAKKANSS